MISRCENKEKRTGNIPVNQFEHFLQDGEQWPSAFDFPSFVLLSLGQIKDLLHLFD